MSEQSPIIAEIDVAVIGAGPAGMAALTVLASQPGLTIHVIDEQPAAGGQIYRQPPGNFSVPHWLDGKLYDAGKQLLAKAQAAPGINWHFSTTVLGIFRSGDTSEKYLLWLSSPAGLVRLKAKAVLIAPGCYDLPVPFPGWTLPGVMATGGIQAFVKSQQIVPGERFLFVGSHPLQLIVADQILKGGGEVAAVVFAQSRMTFLKAAANLKVIAQHARKFLEIARILVRLQRAGVPVLFGQAIRRAEGQGAVSSATIGKIDRRGRAIAGTEHVIACDRVGSCHGFLPSAELARQAGIEAEWDSASGGGWIIPHDDFMRTAKQGIYVAGEITGVAGAEVAAAEGHLAAHAILLDLGRVRATEIAEPIARVKSELQRLDEFARLLTALGRPPVDLLDSLTTDDTILCRCETITVKQFDAALAAAPHLQTADAVKLACRTGMGLCQGRYCGHAVTRRLAKVHNLGEAQVGGFTPRPPVKPVLISDLVR
ncbi:NAD(P)/FAD-dependent oxidoreductase [Govanella unica]|uniref:FAD-dependent oxidoreductase n=1 Tax=Govanella unica TaxID=2975056 RepID=A0A9X3Z700_9PROT|nr:NAD(P)/FAD-dependent oxidoreductase [Govania unica]MDA5193459.1 FAD-dependent oxidoreductase [Govania unica]